MSNQLSIPSQKYLTDLGSAMQIKIKTFDQVKDMKNVKDALSGIVGIFGDGTESKIPEVDFKQIATDATKPISDLGNKILKNIKNYKTGDELSTTEVAVINTYIPNTFGLKLVGNWKTNNLISVEPLVEKALMTGVKIGSGPNVASLLQMAYSSMKATAERIGGFSLSSRQSKLFEPDFATQDLEFILSADTQEEADNIEYATMILRECMIPYNVLNQEMFALPALVDLKMVMTGSGENDTMSTKDLQLQEDLFSHYKNMGITKFNATSISGEQLNLNIKDGKFGTTKWEISLTTIDRLFADSTVGGRISAIMDKIQK